MGADEYHPISRQGSNLTEAGGIGYTVVDALDTMLIMGLDEEYQRARSWVADKMTFERDADYNTFEVGPFPSGFCACALHAFAPDYDPRARRPPRRVPPLGRRRALPDASAGSRRPHASRVRNTVWAPAVDGQSPETPGRQ
jgi:hypothetical protein